MPVFMLERALRFPPAELALPEGLLAVGGDLSVERLALAYRSGIFPWYSAGEPLMWWSPDPRSTLLPGRLKVARSMRPLLNRGAYGITFDRAFDEVVAACARVSRHDQDGTWITPEMAAAYGRLHEAGLAHSVEAWEGEALVGGLYGVAIGACFFGESMFSRRPNASKYALIVLVRRLAPRGLELVDCQLPTRHLESLGAEPVARAAFLEQLRGLVDKPAPVASWRNELEEAPAGRAFGWQP